MSKRGSFFNRGGCAVTLLETPADLQTMLGLPGVAAEEGADAVAIDISCIPLEERTVENFRRTVESTSLPCMFICYRSDNFLTDNDAARQEYLLRAAEAGAEVIDVMGDLYAPAERELTMDAEAIAAQKALIARIHGLGAKVIISSHFQHGTMQPEEVLAHLREQRSRGADICKLVIRADNEDEFHNALCALSLLKKEFPHPFVFLCGGRFARLFRYIGLKSGVAVQFAVRESKRHNAVPQPSIKSFLNIRDNLDWSL
ncbi:MAG: type I 3-dehydroquinate dehydratase [Victivallales bacterium]|nr:type I 3-dehydroquinate dehydratase [Victivallales bacterium]